MKIVSNFPAMDLSVETIYDEICFGFTPLPVLSWSCTDGNGHRHKWVGETEINAKLPSLGWIIDVPGNEEYPEQGHYECIKCGESVIPEAHIDPNKVFYIVRCYEYRKNGELITKEEYNKLLKNFKK